MSQGCANNLPDNIFRWVLAWIPFSFSTFILINTTIILLNTLVIFSVKAWNKWKHNETRQKDDIIYKKTSKSKTTKPTWFNRHTKNKHRTNESLTKSMKSISRKHLKGQDKVRKHIRTTKYELEDMDNESQLGGGATLDEITWLSTTDESPCHSVFPRAGLVSSKSQINLSCKKQTNFRSMPPEYVFGAWHDNETPVKCLRHHCPHPILKTTETTPTKRKRETFQFHSTFNPNGDYPSQYQKRCKTKRRKLKKHFRRLAKHSISPHRSMTRLLYSDHNNFKHQHCSPTGKTRKTKKGNSELVSSMTSVWSNSIVEPNTGNTPSVSSDNQVKSNKSELSTNLNRDSWIWFSPLSLAGVDNFTTRQTQFRSTDPRVPQLIEEIHRQDQMNKDILREANSLEIPSKGVNKTEKFNRKRTESSTRQGSNPGQNLQSKQATPPQNKRRLPHTLESSSPRLRRNTKHRNNVINEHANDIPTRSLQLDSEESTTNKQQPHENNGHLTCSKNNEVKLSRTDGKIMNKNPRTPEHEKQNFRRNQHRFNQSKVVHAFRSAPEKIREEGVANTKTSPDNDPIRNSNNILHVSCPHGDGQPIHLSPIRSRPSSLRDFPNLKYEFQFPNVKFLKKHSPVKEFPKSERKRVCRTRSEFDIRDSSKGNITICDPTTYKVKPSVSCVFQHYSTKRSTEQCTGSPVKILNFIHHEPPTESDTQETIYLPSPTDPLNIKNDMQSKSVGNPSADIYLSRTPAVHTREESESDSFFVQSSSLDNSTTKATTQIGQEVSRTIKNLIFNNDSNSSVSTSNKIQPGSNKNKSISPTVQLNGFTINAKQVSSSNYEQPKHKSPDRNLEVLVSCNSNNKHLSPSMNPKKQQRPRVFSSKYYLGKRVHKHGITKHDK